jgi:superoxide dismutase, Fe-Mn family
MHKLPELPYAANGLEPHIDAKTMEIHHGKHHQAYVDKLNAALETQPELAGEEIADLITDIEGLPEAIMTAVRNNGGGHWNHSFFWNIMTPGGNSEISTELSAAIDEAFESMDKFKEAFAAAGMGRFGSGWAWLIKTTDGKLKITSTPNQDNPLMDVAEVQGTPILGLDVWEHAYYLNYQNRRPDYIGAWWNVVNWEKVSELFAG